MICVTGDCHANWSRFNTFLFPEQKNMTKEDYLIVAGDFGIWHDNKQERYELDKLSEKPFTTLFIDGNHENFDRLYSDEFEIVDFHGGKAHKIREGIYHLLRGYVYELGGKKIFAFGGASSHDVSDGILNRTDFESEEDFKKTCDTWWSAGKMFRVNHLSWWKEELPSDEEMKRGIENLRANNNKIDFIVTHCCPQEIASTFSMGLYKKDILTQYFNTVAETVDFDKWFFGHYHDNRVIMEKYVMLYEQILRIV